MQTTKEAARQAIDRLPDQATWEDIMYELYVKQKIEAGLRAAEEGRTIAHEEMKRRIAAKKRHIRRMNPWLDTVLLPRQMRGEGREGTARGGRTRVRRTPGPGPAWEAEPGP